MLGKDWRLLFSLTCYSVVNLRIDRDKDGLFVYNNSKPYIDLVRELLLLLFVIDCLFVCLFC